MTCDVAKVHLETTEQLMEPDNATDLGNIKLYASLCIILLFPNYVVSANGYDNSVGTRCLTVSEAGDFGDCHDRFKYDELDARCLNLSDKCLKGLPSNLFQCLPNIREVDLSVNKYEVVPTRALRGLVTELHYLKMDNNLIKSLDGALAGLRGLTRISFASNLIEGIPKDVFDLPHLKILDFTNNSITELPCSDDFNYYTVISVVNLRDNPLVQLNLNCIARLDGVTGITANDSIIQATRIGVGPLEFMIGGTESAISCERNTIDASDFPALLTVNVLCRFEDGTRSKLVFPVVIGTTIKRYTDDNSPTAHNAPIYVGISLMAAVGVAFVLVMGRRKKRKRFSKWLARFYE